MPAAGAQMPAMMAPATSDNDGASSMACPTPAPAVMPPGYMVLTVDPAVHYAAVLWLQLRQPVLCRTSGDRDVDDRHPGNLDRHQVGPSPRPV